MRAGQLRKLIDLQEQSTAQDDHNQPVGDYGTYDSVWANIVPLRGDALAAAQQLNNLVTHRIEVRFSEKIKAKHRILYDGRIFDIITVLNRGERDRRQDLMCNEVIE